MEPSTVSKFAPENPKPEKPKNGDDASADTTRSAPDPFAAVLPALAALGAIASIASINWSAEEKTPDRPKAKRKAATALRDLETCCMGLIEIFRRFHKHPKLFSGEGSAANTPLKFGVHGVRVSGDTARHYQQIINDVASMLVLASQNAFDVMSAVEDGEIDAPEEIFYGFGECQEILNELIQQRATLKSCVERGYQVAQRLSRLVAELKKHKVD